MGMSMLISVRSELRIRPLLSARGQLLCATCSEHGRESVLVVVHTRHHWYALCLFPGCRDGISRDEAMCRPARGKKGWTKKAWIIISLRSLPPAAAAELDDAIAKNGRESQWARERLKGQLPPPVERARFGANGNERTKGMRLGPRPKREKHRHKNRSR